MNQSKIKFSYKNEFDNEVSIEETFNIETLEAVGENSFEYILERFKAFLKFAQFSEKMVNKIQYLDENN